MNWIIEQLPCWNSWIAVLLYWLPLALCTYGYTLRSVHKFRKDRAARADAEAKDGFYIPSVSVGTLVGYSTLAVVPIATQRMKRRAERSARSKNRR